MTARVFTYERAGAVVIDGDRVLLVSMEPPGEPRWWHFPGGGIELGETPRAAAIRELFEETGLRATDATELLRAGIHGGYHHYFLVTCENLEIGAVTGPELQYAENADFKAEWVPIAELPVLPVWPRCDAERIAGPLDPPTRPIYVEDDRQSWDGVPGASSPSNIRIAARVVLFRTDERHQVAAIERSRGDNRYFTLPGGGLEVGEAVDDAIRRETLEELGLEVLAGNKLAVVVYGRAGRVTLQTYCEGVILGGEFGTGTGDEFTDERQRVRGSYRPVWLEVDDLPLDLRPTWLLDRLPAWARSLPARPERFCEIHED
jgi:ADP-ribose pyrophosphatase YjhB (NUDIX family)